MAALLPPLSTSIVSPPPPSHLAVSPHLCVSVSRLTVTLAGRVQPWPGLARQGKLNKRGSRRRTRRGDAPCSSWGFKIQYLAFLSQLRHHLAVAHQETTSVSFFTKCKAENWNHVTRIIQSKLYKPKTEMNNLKEQEWSLSQKDQEKVVSLEGNPPKPTRLRMAQSKSRPQRDLTHTNSTNAG